MYKNYSTSLFSLNKSEPTTLPFRFRLNSGETRYNYYVSLEELNSCGYFGPFVEPLYDAKNQKCIWDSSTLNYIILNKTKEEKAEEENINVRNKLNNLLTAYSTINFPVLSIEANKAYIDYFNTIKIKLESESLLTPDDVPTLELPPIMLEADAKVVYDSIVTPETLNVWKNEFITWDNKLWEADVIVNNRFSIPPDWVRPD